MRRLFKMTDKAKQALHSHNWIPTQFLVDGDAKYGYSIHYVDEDLIGCSIVKDHGLIRSFYAVKQIIEEINNVGKPINYAPILDMRSFAWHSYPLPQIN